MNKRLNQLLLSSLLTLPITLASAQPNEEEIIAKSRSVVTSFEKQLGGKLKNAMKSKGPLTAIDVCSKEADTIADQVSKQFEVTVKRVTDKPRNPENAATPQEQLVLAQLAQLIQDNPSQPAELIRSTNNAFHYYRAITTKGLCLTCHGTAVAAPIKERLAAHYPNDKATGYQVDQLRGAFVVEWKN